MFPYRLILTSLVNVIHAAEIIVYTGTLHSPQLLDITPSDEAEEEGGHMDLDAQRKGKAAVIKTSTRQVGLFLCVTVHA